MNSKACKALRLIAREDTVGEGVDSTRLAYRALKRACRSNPQIDAQRPKPRRINGVPSATAPNRAEFEIQRHRIDVIWTKAARKQARILAKARG